MTTSRCGSPISCAPAPFDSLRLLSLARPGRLATVGAEVGKTESVEQAEFRRKDQRKARSIALLSAPVGLVVAAAGFFIVTA